MGLTAQRRKNRQMGRLLTGILYRKSLVIGALVALNVAAAIGLYYYFGNETSAKSELLVEKESLDYSLQLAGSRDIFLKAMKDDPFTQVQYFNAGGFFGKKEVYSQSPFQLAGANVSSFLQDRWMEVKAVSENQLEVTFHLESGKETRKTSFGQPVTIGEDVIEIVRNPLSGKEMGTEPWFFKIPSDAELVNQFGWSLQVLNNKFSPRKVTLLLVVENRLRAVNLLQKLIAHLEERARLDREGSLRKKIGLLDENIQELEKDLWSDSLFYAGKMANQPDFFKDLGSKYTVLTNLHARREKMLRKAELIQLLKTDPTFIRKFESEFVSLKESAEDNKLLDLVRKKIKLLNSLESTPENFGKLETVSVEIITQIATLENFEKLRLKSISDEIDKVEGQTARFANEGYVLLRRAIENSPDELKSVFRWNELGVLLTEMNLLRDQLVSLAPQFRVMEQPHRINRKVGYRRVRKWLSPLLMLLAGYISWILISPFVSRKIKNAETAIFFSELPNLAVVRGGKDRKNASKKAAVALLQRKAGKIVGITSPNGSVNEITEDIKASLLSIGVQAAIFSPSRNQAGDETDKPGWLADDFAEKLTAAAADQDVLLVPFPPAGLRPEVFPGLNACNTLVIVYETSRTTRAEIAHMEEDLADLVEGKRIFSVIKHH